jgi:hypothetical protein
MWDELGIEPCGDPKAIRRAYAVRLKSIDQDRDPAAFTRLRDALDWALAAAQRAELDARADEDHRSAIEEWEAEYLAFSLTDEPANDDEASSQTDGPASRRTADVPAPQRDAAAGDRELVMQLESALDRRDAAAAVPLYYRAAATGAIPLHDAAPLLEQLFALSIAAPLLPAEAFCRLARDFGWDKPLPDGGATGALRASVLARLAAEDWYRSLVDRAARRGGETRKQARLARLMLGRTGRVLMPRVDREALRQYLDQWRTHQPWLSGLLDPAWVSTLERRLRRRDIASALFYALFLAAFLLDGIVVVLTAVARGELPFWGFPVAAAGAVFLLLLLQLLLAQLRLLMVRPVAKAAAPPPPPPPPEHLLVQLRWLERQAEQAVDGMYGAMPGTATAACYSNAKEFFHDAIALARQLGDTATAERLSQRLAAIKATYRSQFS